MIAVADAVNVATTPATPPPAPTPAPSVARPAPASRPAPDTETWQSIYDQMSASLPGTWVVRAQGHWGQTNLSTGVVSIAPTTPANRLRDVMWHEAVHVRQHQVYGSYAATRAGLASYGGMEAVADCGAKLMGARWTGYTSQCSAAQTQAARDLLAGRRPAAN